jgi:hypothetical protein
MKRNLDILTVVLQAETLHAFIRMHDGRSLSVADTRMRVFASCGATRRRLFDVARAEAPQKRLDVTLTSPFIG